MKANSPMHLILLSAIILALPVAPIAHAAEDNVTPYGDYCQWYSIYGVCKETLKPLEAMDAIEKYYAEKGIKAVNMQHKGRFIETDIYKDERLIDKVLFDRKTGRIRSIY